MAEDIIWSNADLAEVTHFADETFLGRGGWITVLVDDRWTLSSQFKDAGNKILSAGRGNKLSLGRRSCKNDHVKPHRSDFDRYLGLSLDHFVA